MSEGREWYGKKAVLPPCWVWLLIIARGAGNDVLPPRVIANLSTLGSSSRPLVNETARAFRSFDDRKQLVFLHLGIFSWVDVVPRRAAADGETPIGESEATCA